jgi:hypothetical protein
VVRHRDSFPGADADTVEDLDTRVLQAGVTRIEAQNRDLIRRDFLVLIRNSILVIILLGVAVAVWTLALGGDPTAVLRLGYLSVSLGRPG